MQTNLYAAQNKANHQNIPPNSSTNHWKETD